MPLREALLVEKSGPKYGLALPTRRSTTEPFKSDFSPSSRLPPDFSKIYDPCVRSRPSFKAIMNYLSRDILTQESWTNALWFKFYRLPHLPHSSSNFCCCILPEMEIESVLQKAGQNTMLIKVIVQGLEMLPCEGSFKPSAPGDQPATAFVLPDCSRSQTSPGFSWLFPLRR